VSQVSTEAISEARRLYEAGGSLHAISRETGLHRATIRKLRDAEAWVPGETPQDRGQVADTVKAAIRADVIGLGRKRGIEQVIESGVVEETADLMATILREQGRLVLSVTRSSQDAFRRYEAGEMDPAQAIVLRAIVGSATQALAAGRDFAGLKSGQPSTLPRTEGEEPIRIEQRRLETVRIAVDEKGRMLDREAS
jgi:hypothetical protein